MGNRKYRRKKVLIIYSPQEMVELPIYIGFHNQYIYDSTGAELAGEVLEVARDVKTLEPGDRVLGLSPNYGAFAEEVAVNETVRNWSLMMGGGS